MSLLCRTESLAVTLLISMEYIFCITTHNYDLHYEIMNMTPSARSGKKFLRIIKRLICIQSAYARINQTGESLHFFTNNDNEIYGYSQIAVYVLRIQT